MFESQMSNTRNTCDTISFITGNLVYNCVTVKLISPLFTVYTFGFIVNNSSLYLFKLLIKVLQLNHTFLMFPIEFPVSVNGVSVVFHAIHHCIVVGTLIFVFSGYMFDLFTCSPNHLYVWVIC